MGWSAKLHSAGNTSGAGNIMLGDGSAQQVTSGNFRLNWLKNAEDAGNFNSTVLHHRQWRRCVDLPVTWQTL